jgi:epsilon-lactone hydrolase
MVLYSKMGAHIINVPFTPSSHQWRIARSFMKIAFRRKVRDVKHTIQLRTQWERFSFLLKHKEGVQCTSFFSDGIQSEWITPSTNFNSSMLYLHGGGYTLGSLNTHRAYLTYLADTINGRVMHIDYRLAPEHPFPAALEDALQAYKWLIGEETEKPIYIAGDSAGGGLALALLLLLRDLKLPLPKGVICFSPWADLTHQGETFKTNQHTDNLLYAPSLPIVAQQYIGNANPQQAYISPVYGDFTGVPPLLIQVAEGEILLSDSVRVFEKVKQVNGSITLEIWEKAFHAWPYAIPLLPESSKALDHVKKFMEECLLA